MTFQTLTLHAKLPTLFQHMKLFPSLITTRRWMTVKRITNQGPQCWRQLSMIRRPYRYANVNVNELLHNLGDVDAITEGLKLVYQRLYYVHANRKQNTFANKTVPQYVMVTVRQDTPVNLVTAFEKPVKSREGYVKASIKYLEDEYKRTQSFVEKPLATFVLTTYDSEINNQEENIESLVNDTVETIETRVNDEDSSN